MVARLLEQTGAPAHLLELELTESLVLDDFQRYAAARAGQWLASIGIRSAD